MRHVDNQHLSSWKGAINKWQTSVELHRFVFTEPHSLGQLGSSRCTHVCTCVYSKGCKDERLVQASYQCDFCFIPRWVRGFQSIEENRKRSPSSWRKAGRSLKWGRLGSGCCTKAQNKNRDFSAQKESHLVRCPGWKRHGPEHLFCHASVFQAEKALAGVDFASWTEKTRLWSGGDQMILDVKALWKVKGIIQR